MLVCIIEIFLTGFELPKNREELIVVTFINLDLVTLLLRLKVLILIMFINTDLTLLKEPLEIWVVLINLSLFAILRFFPICICAEVSALRKECILSVYTVFTLGL